MEKQADSAVENVPIASSATEPVDAPPSYQQEQDDPDEIVQPNVFVLEDRFVYAESAQSIPLYELSRSFPGGFTRVTEEINFWRLGHRVKVLSYGSPKVVGKKQHLYDLMHPRLRIEEPEYEFQLESISRQALGNLGLRKSPFPHSGHRAYTMMSEKQKSSGKKDEVVFSMKAKHDVIEWTDTDGKPVATGHGREGLNKLLVKESMSRKNLDAMVAMWCLWIWKNYEEDNRPQKTWADSEYITHPNPRLTSCVSDLKLCREKNTRNG